MPSKKFDNLGTKVIKKRVVRKKAAAVKKMEFVHYVKMQHASWNANGRLNDEKHSPDVHGIASSEVCDMCDKTISTFKEQYELYLKG